MATAAAAAAAAAAASPTDSDSNSIINRHRRIHSRRCSSILRSNNISCPPLTPALKLPSSPFLLLLNSNRCRRRFAPPLRAASSPSSSSSFPLGANLGRRIGVPDVENNGNVGFLGRLRSGLLLLRYVFPGGSWWKLEQEEGMKVNAEEQDRGKKGLSVITALRRMWELVAKDRLVIFLAFASLLFAALSEVSIPHFLTASIFSAQTHESMMFYRNARLLVLLCFISGICSGLRGCCFGIANMMRMREMLYDSLLFQDVSFLDNETVGDLTSRLGSDCQQVSRVIGNDLNLISRNLLQATGALIYLFILSWRLTLSTLLICTALLTIVLFYGRYQKKAAKLTQELTASANEVAQEALSLFRTVRVYGTEKQEFGRYVNWLERLSEVSLRQSVAYGYCSLSFNFLYHSTQVIAVLVGGISILSGQMTAEQLTKFILYSEWMIYSTWWVGDNWSSLMQSIGASEKVFELMDLLPSNQFLSEGLKLQKLVGHIDFVDVSFSYPSRSMVPVLKQVNLSVHPNEVVAIVGLSGSGKSTLLNLLLRLFEPTNGQILVDGVPLSDLDIKWLRQNIGYVGQEPRLFRMDISSNIRYGCPREVGREEVEWAAKQAYAHEFISALPNGYGTLVDDTLLSGGQKQRIAIARAILRDPTILILDEATSALDAESEYYVKEVLRTMQNSSSIKRTIFVIAHRLSTIQAADRIIVMDGGRIVEMGKHMELIQRDGLYARLVRRQADAFAY
ncbi:ABC transporter B family member 26, chloroplastic-like isoform X2 [Musa acuminata AAA Group]|uniref:ABC transporter B family member 26, chloroplastic-like isoform X2 n=1 Tax=Musa acuminata AAA Group TaxID=214697 RepID=UPI0031DC4722